MFVCTLRRHALISFRIEIWTFKYVKHTLPRSANTFDSREYTILRNCIFNIFLAKQIPDLFQR